MTKVRRPILVAANLLLVLLGLGLFACGMAIRLSGNLALLHHPPANEVQAKVYQVTDIKKLQALAVNQYEYLDSLATMAEGSRGLAFASGVVVIVLGIVNFTLIPWRLRKNEPPA